MLGVGRGGSCQETSKQKPFESWPGPRGPAPPTQGHPCDSEATGAGQGYPDQKHSQSPWISASGHSSPEKDQPPAMRRTNHLALSWWKWQAGTLLLLCLQVKCNPYYMYLPPSTSPTQWVLTCKYPFFPAALFSQYQWLFQHSVWHGLGLEPALNNPVLTG